MNDVITRINNFFTDFTDKPEIMIAVIVGVLGFTVFYYYIIKFLLDNDSKSLVVVFVIVCLVGGIIVSLAEDLNCAIFLLIPTLFVLAIFVLYPVELKRLIWNRMSVKRDSKHANTASSIDEEKIQSCINEIIRALQNMSKNDVGAIIVLTSSEFPSQILDSGVRVDSDISSALIESIFFPKTPLHDGAMIVSGTRIVAAGCFLPLTQRVDNVPKDLGTRHRAGIGVTEAIDVISLIVSEETGIISVARGGKITRYVDMDSLKKILVKYYWQELDGTVN